MLPTRRSVACQVAVVAIVLLGLIAAAASPAGAAGPERRGGWSGEDGSTPSSTTSSTKTSSTTTTSTSVRPTTTTTTPASTTTDPPGTTSTTAPAPRGATAVSPATTNGKSPSTAACASVFSPDETNFLESWYGSHDITASIYDERTGCSYELAPGRRNTTASVFKISMMGRVLLAAQDAGRALTPAEDALIWPMITQSDDNATSNLFIQFGGVPAMNAFYARMGMGATNTPSGVWGLTTTSARDQVELVRMLLGDRFGVFSDYSRAAALHYMSSVVPGQSWGVSAGLPGGWSAALKNGFASSACCAWRINSAGRVRSPVGDGYELVVLTDNWGTEGQGITELEKVTSSINGRLARDQTAGARPGGGPVTVNADGRLEAFGITGAGQLENAFQYQIGLGWSGWYGHPGTWASAQQPSTVTNVDDRLEVFVLTADGHVRHSVQLPIGQGWSAEEDLGGGFAFGPTAARNLDGRLEVFAVGQGGELWHRWQSTPGGGWSDWAALASGFGGAPGVGVGADGRLVVAAVTAGGALQASTQIMPNGAWTPMSTVGTNATGRPSVTHNQDGRFEVAVRGTDGRLWHSWQQGFVWATPVPFSDITYAEAPTLATNADGRLEVFGVDQTGQLIHQFQTAPNTGWTGPYFLGAGLDGPATVATNDDGRLEVFAIGADHGLWHSYQFAPNVAWSPLYTLGGNHVAG